MNVQVGKCLARSRRCQVKIKELTLSWRKDRQCKNTARYTVNGKCMCLAHARKKIFEVYLLENPPV